MTFWTISPKHSPKHETHVQVCVTITERTRDLLDDIAEATGLPSAKSKQYRAVCRATILDGLLTVAEKEAEKLPPFQPSVKEGDSGSGGKEKEGDGGSGCKEKEGDASAGEAGGDKEDRANGLKLCKVKSSKSEPRLPHALNMSSCARRGDALKRRSSHGM